MRKGLSLIVALMMAALPMAAMAEATQTAAPQAQEQAADQQAADQTTEQQADMTPAPATEDAAEADDMDAQQTAEQQNAAQQNNEQNAAQQNGEQPVTVTDGIGNSGNIRADLTAEQLMNLTLNANNVNVDIVETTEAPYAELDATVIGINSADVDYDMTVTEAEGGVTIDTHHTGSDIGVNRVKLTIHAPQNAIEQLTLSLQDSYLVLDNLGQMNVSGTVTNGNLDGRNMAIGQLDVEATDTDINIERSLGDVTLNTTGGSVKLHSETVPTSVMIDANETDVELRVPDNAEGFAMNYDVTEGNLSTNLAEDFAEQSGTVTIGDGASQFDITVRNANLRVDRY